MPPIFNLNGGRIALSAIAIVFFIVMPLVLGALAHRRLGVSWRYFGYGALIFFLFQIITRVPAVTVIQGALAEQLRTSQALQLGFGAALALTAGLFEEVGRYVGYRWLMRREEKTWSKAIMYGLGHGGIESMLLIGARGLLQLISLLLLAARGLDSIPAPQRAQAAQQLAALASGPVWTPLLGIWERTWAIIFHVALSVLVLQVFRRNNIRWLWLAILLHALLDFCAVLVPVLLPGQLIGTLILEGIVGLFGLLGLWIIQRLRDRAADTTVMEPA